MPDKRPSPEGGERLSNPSKLRRIAGFAFRRAGPFGCAVAAACGGVPDGTEPGVAYDTIAGVEHVISSDSGAWSAAGGAWRIDESGGVSIGQVDGPEEYVFGRVSGVAVDPEGRIHVADSQAREIRVFSPSGEYLRTLGRNGEGPGEFRDISGLAVGPGGVAALDGSLGRVTVFEPEGEVDRLFRLERSYMILEFNAPMAFDAQSRFFERARLSLTPGTDSLGVVTYDASGERVGTALLAVVTEDQVMLERNGVPYMSIPRPFAPQPSIAFGPDGTVHLTRGDEYRIDVFSPAGDSLRAIRRVVAPVPVSAAERDSALARIAETFEEHGGRLPDVELPEHKPTIARLVVDSGGNLWVLTTEDARGFEWSVHDVHGRYLGAVRTPAMAVMQIGNDFVAGTMRDELGVQTAIVLPILKLRPRS